MASHYEVPIVLNKNVNDMLTDFTLNVRKISSMTPFDRYIHKGVSFQRLTDRNEPNDTDVITLSPTTLYDRMGEIADFCIAEVHMSITKNQSHINKIYCVL